MRYEPQTFVYFLLVFFWALTLYELWYTLFGPCSDVPLNKEGKEPLFGFSGGGCSDDEKAQTNASGDKK
mgnify:CR=1 FL=1